MSNIGFLSLPLDIELEYLEPTTWDRQTLAILYCGNIGTKVMNSIRRTYKPTAHSEGRGYIIDVYTNLNYSPDEKDPAMRNIRCVYCNFDIMTLEEINRRFPNAYIVRVRAERRDIHADFTRQIGGEILKIPCN